MAHSPLKVKVGRPGYCQSATVSVVAPAIRLSTWPQYTCAKGSGITYQTVQNRGIQLESKPTKPLTVDKDKFDALLRRMLKADPTQRKDIEIDKKKPGKIIPPSS
jgi:hypothetical protein